MKRGRCDIFRDMIRKTTPSDHNALIELATASRLFEPSQTDELAQMLTDYHQAGSGTRDVWLTDDDDGYLVSVAYFAPERMTEGTWSLYLIAVHPSWQKQGRGKAMLDHVVDSLALHGERILLVETSGTEDFDYVREFYRNNGFTEEARIREFYAAGVDKIVYRKQLPQNVGLRAGL